MSGMYGTVKPADINIEQDVEIFYHYRPAMNQEDVSFTNFKPLNTNVLTPCTTGDTGDVTISGLFNLKLPLSQFSQKGIYTIYIRPKEIETTIKDIGVLAAYPDIRGVILSSENSMERFKGNNSLCGYRIEYISNKQKTGNFTIITSSNLAAPTSSVVTNVSEKGSISYYFTNAGQDIFCTVTPSLASTFKPNDKPFIGNIGDTIKIVNTKFNPIMLELEMVEHDEETISYMLEGNQLIDKDNALITTFNPFGEIYHQTEYGVYKDSYGTPLYEFKKTRDNIDANQSLENLE